MARNLDSAVAAYLDAILWGPLNGHGKVFLDWMPTLPMPYIVIFQPMEAEDFQSAGQDGIDSSIGIGQLQVSCYAGRRQDAEDIGNLVIDTLTDAELIFDHGRLLELRPSSQSWSPESLTGLDAGGDSIFHRVLVFQYAVQR